MAMQSIHHLEEDGRGQFFLGDSAQPDAAMMYHRWGDSAQQINIDHTEVSDALRGQGVGELLFHKLLEWARGEKLKVSATCPFAETMFKRHEGKQDLYVEYVDERRKSV